MHRRAAAVGAHVCLVGRLWKAKIEAKIDAASDHVGRRWLRAVNFAWVALYAALLLEGGLRMRCYMTVTCGYM